MQVSPRQEVQGTDPSDMSVEQKFEVWEACEAARRLSIEAGCHDRRNVPIPRDCVRTPLTASRLC